MASATKKTRQTYVTKTIDDGVTLQLSQAEALALCAILERIGGHGNTARGYQTKITLALISAGIRLPYGSLESDKVKGSIVFQPGSREAIDKLAGEAQQVDQAVGQVSVEKAFADYSNQQKGNPFAAQYAAGAAIQGCLDKIPSNY